ncbi:uncharacterized protein LOC135847616 isoform X2 [Planococcus citri]|uniref:uncharacterized protein LOC135847616 isoform X2 n=1 Tax=Planococcus citri TaxID=170843 RepID=UPI0031F89082
MAEIRVVPVLYDIAQPTPVSLQDLSAIAVSLGIWRNEILKYRKMNRMHEFCRLPPDFSSKSALLPSVFYDVIKEYVHRFLVSARKWLSAHYKSIFQRGRYCETSVLEVFDDFVSDYNGAIDYARTAKRMMVCDGLSEVEKFAVACTYFFEDDITRIWPSVCQSFDLNKMYFHECPQLYYWICHLRNELHRIPSQWNGRSVDEIMFDHHMVENRPSLEYFWSRLPLENQMEKAVNIFHRGVKLFVTFALSKLNDQQLDIFLNRYGCKLILKMLNNRLYYSCFFQPTWKFIENKMNESTFRSLVLEILKLELTSEFEWSMRLPRNWLHCCSEIWNSIEANVKQSIVEDILSNTRLLNEKMRSYQYYSRSVGFLLLILPLATSESRSAFWRDCWPHLLQGTRIDHLKRIMQLCFDNEEEIAQFKRDNFAESENMRIRCSKLLNDDIAGMFDKLNDFVKFCCPEVKAAKSYKQQLLQSTFLLENSSFTRSLVDRVDEFSVFIDDTFENKYQSADFKNRLMSSPAVQEVLSHYPCSYSPSFEPMMKLVDTFVSTQETLRAIKMRIISFLTEVNSTGNWSDRYFYECRCRSPRFDLFLLWLLGSVNEVERFRQNYIP